MGTAQELLVTSWQEHPAGGWDVCVCVAFLNVWAFTQSYSYDIPGLGLLVVEIGKVVQTTKFSTVWKLADSSQA